MNSDVREPFYRDSLQLIKTDRLRKTKVSTLDLNTKVEIKKSLQPETKISKTTSFLRSNTTLNTFNAFADKKKDQSFNHMFKASPINVGLDKFPAAEKQEEK